ncbi:MAG: hypothetical protein COT17_03470 [Elusimicrobia bacterium CG08_land_8_20_14_0_20_51_18]|nr:MAG: hypothetical protein COT17_03470 [Elusimicrobia bacterium CG08_land_8_20_14_0_20_51_18]
MLEGVKVFFSLWFLRFRLFAFLFAIWAVVFSTNTIIGSSVAFEYDDGLVYSGDLFRKAENKKLPPDGQIYWEFINENRRLERLKPVPCLSALVFRLAGFRVDAVADRGEAASPALKSSWRRLCAGFYFAKDQNEKFSILEKNRYFIFFSSSDEGIIQARKAGTHAVRIKRNAKSAGKLAYNPGKFREKIMILSEF